MLSLHCSELPDLPDQDEPAAAEHKGGAAQDRRRVRPTDLASGEEKRSFAKIAIVSSLCNSSDGFGPDYHRFRGSKLASVEPQSSVRLYILDWLFKCGLRRSPASPFENGRARPNVDLANL